MPRGERPRPSWPRSASISPPGSPGSRAVIEKLPFAWLPVSGPPQSPSGTTSPARISQIRLELAAAWRLFQGESNLRARKRVRPKRSTKSIDRRFPAVVGNKITKGPRSMSVTITVGFSRKVGEPNYGSRGASLHLEMSSSEVRSTTRKAFGPRSRAFSSKLGRPLIGSCNGRARHPRSRMDPRMDQPMRNLKMVAAKPRVLRHSTRFARSRKSHDIDRSFCRSCSRHGLPEEP